VTAVGEARPGKANPSSGPILALVEIRLTERCVRDFWILRTAELTIGRLARVNRALRAGTEDPLIAAACQHYKITGTDIRDMADMVRDALAAVTTSPGGEPALVNARETLLAVIRESSGKSGISFDRIVEEGKKTGIDETRAREIIKSLLEDDEIYQPSREVFKPL